jgi:hypothetical protein
MNEIKKIILIIALALFSTGAWGEEVSNPLLKTVLESRTCTVNSFNSRVCRFRIGNDLDFEITAIGEPDVSVTVLKASDFDNADYYLKFGGVHGCIIIGGPEPLDYVFIHPRTAEVYEVYPNCWPAGDTN